MVILRLLREKVFASSSTLIPLFSAVSWQLKLVDVD